MIIVKGIQLCLIIAIGAVLWLFTCVGFHELGHVFAAKTMTKDEYRIDTVQIWPSLQVYPELKYSPSTTTMLGDTSVALVGKAEPMAQMNTFKAELELSLDIDAQNNGRNVAGYARTTGVPPLDPEKLDETRAQADYNVISLMGSVMTGFVSLVAIVCLVCFDLTGFRMFLASVFGLLHLDALLYSLMPSFGLPHLAVAGDKVPEPIAALSYFGIAPMWSFTVFALLSFLQLGLLVHHWQKPRKN